MSPIFHHAWSTCRVTKKLLRVEESCCEMLSAGLLWATNFGLVVSLSSNSQIVTQQICLSLVHTCAISITQVILVPRAHDHCDLRQLSRALAGPDFLSLRRVFVSHSQPISFARFDGKSVNRGLPVLDKARALDPCRRSEWSWALGKRMNTSEISISASTRKKGHVSLSCTYACVYFTGVMLISQVGTCLFHWCYAY